ncbi:MAG: YraN family protein [Chloroflexi bacterium]|nr:YraN family protein [Chloroflexota bacterium]
MPEAQEIGALGEELAQRYLRRKGYVILEANWSSLYGELDIIAEKDEQLIFIEVKARRGADTEAALAGITAAKRERTLKAVYQYLDHRALDWDSPWRIDVIAIALDRGGGMEIAHVEDAFDW